jgi:hypothetical protein
MDQQHLDELVAADAQGERAVMSLWPGDQFYFKGRFWEIAQMQWHQDRARIFITTSEPEAESYMLVGLDGREIVHQPRKSFLLHGLVTVPAILSEEHFVSEHPEMQEAW